MGDQPMPMIQVGKVTRVFSDLGCIGIQVTGRGFQYGDKLFFETNRQSSPDCIIIANSIQINKQPVDQVAVGDKCAVQIPVTARDLPPYGTLVFLVGKESASDSPNRQSLCFQTDDDGAC